MKLLREAAAEEGRQVSEVQDELETGGEDFPDAYRHSPMDQEDALMCIVVYWHFVWNRPA